jgi:hypothetical protein
MSYYTVDDIYFLLLFLTVHKSQSYTLDGAHKTLQMAT